MQEIKSINGRRSLLTKVHNLILPSNYHYPTLWQWKEKIYLSPSTIFPSPVFYLAHANIWLKYQGSKKQSVETYRFLLNLQREIMVPDVGSASSLFVLSFIHESLF